MNRQDIREVVALLCSTLILGSVVAIFLAQI
jgi:hypothetical protein